MLNVGPAELIVIFVAALLLLGPKRLPEVARGLGKFLREFRRQTDEVRSVVEREFYRMDEELGAQPPAASPALVAPPAVEPLNPPLDPSLASTHKEPSLPYGMPVAREAMPPPTPPSPVAPGPLDASTASTQQFSTFVPATPVARAAQPAVEPAEPAPPPPSRQE